MSKPEDIPQNVWDEALRLWQDEEADPGEVIVARAIMAATAAEREACAEKCDRIAERYHAVSPSAQLYAGGAMGAADSAAAIRKRGEA